MGRFFLAGAACLVCILPCQSQEERKQLAVATPSSSRPVFVLANAISRGPQYPSVVRLAGNVEIRTAVCVPAGPNESTVCDGEMIVRADEAILQEDTGEIEARGTVHITPLRHEK